MRKNEADVRFIRLLKYSRWDAKQFCWIIPNYPGTLNLINDYFKEYKPKEWLFEGVKGRQYSVSSVQSIVKAAYKRAGIKKNVSTHTLRHSFATDLLENGTDLRYIQTLMGHESSKTTEIYTHTTTKGFDQIQNPLDKLDF